MKPLPAAWRALWRPVAVVVVLVAAAAVAVLPGSAFSTGICEGCDGAASAPAGDFTKFGCAACHGPLNEFKPFDTSRIHFQVRDAEGAFLNGPYEAEAAYTITISLDESVAPDGGDRGNHAGFNLRASAGKLAAVAGESQASGDGLQATHVSGARTSWNVSWTAPASGPVSFRLFVNDVDGSGSQDVADTPVQAFFGLTDEEGAVLGAPAEEEHKEFGISLQQYWIGLVGLAGMIFIMVAGFVYLKFVNPHNTDQKDR